MFWRPVGLLRLVILSFCAFLLYPIAFTSPAYAASDPITVTAQSDAINFPKSIDFTMNAVDSNSNITSATIFIMYNTDGYRAPHNATITSNPGGSITALWHEDTSSSKNFEPPGTQVTYYWQLQDKVGYVHTENLQKFTTVDTRFTWQHLSEGMLQVNWYDRSQDFGQIMLNQTEASVNRISGTLGGNPNRLLNLWIYKTVDDFHGSLSPNSYEWVGGIAFPSLNEASIVVTSPSDDTLVRDMPHELTHLIFHQLTAQGIEAPTWFDEGLAVYNQAYHESEMVQRLDEALANHTLLRLDNISLGFPSNAEQAYLAYGQSWNLVDYMYSTFGKAKMGLFIKQMDNRQLVFNQDLVQALGVDQIHLENQWRVHLKQPPVLPPEQLTPTIQQTAQAKPQPIKVQADPDTSAPLLVFIGTLLILSPIAGFVIILVIQRRKEQKGWAVQTAQQIIAMSMTPHQPDTSTPYSPPYTEYPNLRPNKQVSQE